MDRCKRRPSIVFHSNRCRSSTRLDRCNRPGNQPWHHIHRLAAAIISLEAYSAHPPLIADRSTDKFLKRQRFMFSQSVDDRSAKLESDCRPTGESFIQLRLAAMRHEIIVYANKHVSGTCSLWSNL